MSFSYDSIVVALFVVVNELCLERYCGGALSTRGSISKSSGCEATKLYGGGIPSFRDESLRVVS